MLALYGGQGFRNLPPLEIYRKVPTWIWCASAHPRMSTSSQSVSNALNTRKHGSLTRFLRWYQVHEMQLTNCSTLQSPMLRFQTISTTRSPGWHPNQSHVIPWTVFGIYLHYLCLYGSFQTEKTSLVEHGCCFSVIHHSMTSLKCYGFLGKPAGIPIRARLTHQQEIDNWCTVHLKGRNQWTSKFHSVVRLMNKLFWNQDELASWWHFAKCS